MPVLAPPTVSENGRVLAEVFVMTLKYIVAVAGTALLVNA